MRGVSVGCEPMVSGGGQSHTLCSCGNNLECLRVGGRELHATEPQGRRYNRHYSFTTTTQLQSTMLHDACGSVT